MFTSLSALGCSRGPATQTAQTPSSADDPEPAELTEVREFRQSIADRRILVDRTEEPSLGRALVTVAEDFYKQHRETLQEAFQTSLGELSDGTPPGPGTARLVGSVDAATPEENDEQRELAQFHLAFTPDIRRQAENAFNAAFVALAASQAEMPVSRAGELYGFFSVAEPRFTRCGTSDVCIHYGQSDIFMVSFTEIEQALWTPAAVSWWTTVPQAPLEEEPPAEGIGQNEAPGEPASARGEPAQAREAAGEAAPPQ